MTAKNAEGLWALIMARYAGNLHLIAHAGEDLPSSMRHHAKLENSVIESWGIEHFGLAESLKEVRDFVERAADFPP